MLAIELFEFPSERGKAMRAVDISQKRNHVRLRMEDSWEIDKIVQRVGTEGDIGNGVSVYAM